MKAAGLAVQSRPGCPDSIISTRSLSMTAIMLSSDGGPSRPGQPALCATTQTSASRAGQACRDSRACLVEEQVRDELGLGFGSCGAPALAQGPILVHPPGAHAAPREHGQAMQAPQRQVARVPQGGVLRCTPACASG